MKQNYFNYLLAIILALLAFAKAFVKKITAYEWPSIDMGPFWEKLADPSVLAHDFFTQASMSPNPRHIFGYFVYGLTKLFGTDWYTVLFGLKCLLIIGLPVLLFFSLVTSQAQNIKTQKHKTLFSLLVFGCTSAIVLVDFVSKIFSIAWWRPYNLVVIPQNITLILGLLGIILFHTCANKKGISRYFYLFCWFLGTMLHPAIGIFIFAFHYALAPQFLSVKRTGLEFILVLFIPSVVVKFVFSTPDSLTAAEFVQAYCYEAHSSHYIPSLFGTLTAFPWWMSMIMIVGLMLMAFGYGFVKKSSLLKTKALIFVTLYMGSVLAQYLFVELKPIRLVATIGVVRFTLFGFWMLVVLYSFVALDLYKYLGGKFDTLFENLSDKVSNIQIPLNIVFYVLALIQIIVLLYIKQDHPIKSLNKKGSLYEWVIKNTPGNSVFMANHNFDFNTNIPIVTKRAIFTGNGFPFSPSAFKEHIKRSQLVFGSREQIESLPGSWIGEKYSNFYRSLSPDDFLKISSKYKLDYIIIEKKYSDKFKKSNFSMVYENSEILVFNIKK